MPSDPIYLNQYTPPQAPREVYGDTPLEDYDQNFVFPPKVLRSDRVELRPFVPSLHAQALAEGVSANPEVMEWLPYRCETLDDARLFIESMFRSQPSALYHAIYSAPPGVDPTPPVDEWKIAGFLGIINASAKDATAEPGFIIIFPKYQRTHVLTHAAGLAMHRILDPESEGGLGLRRCQWYTTVLNLKSQAAALRLGYKHEGIIRAQRVLLEGWQGSRPGRPPHEKNQARDSWLASVIWEEWEGGVREHIDKLMARRS
ncbi:acyl-CoA N-acyltransferase [Kockovaella imperatae]|uniref:Acyl-CoA N-acyltransferase n=1 Tax=Kockovaella imperatae TaxID=4999 RepID=A0A1Y1UH59_9TREE|nr:acyl-CoA N-acyltransferase [Kockovaella imperatae]ORX37319.1 acyl-CoA N-acyltransferase [Kockovaella imperatae]